MRKKHKKKKGGWGPTPPSRPRCEIYKFIITCCSGPISTYLVCIQNQGVKIYIDMHFYMHKSIIVSVSVHFQRSQETLIINQLEEIKHTLLLLLLFTTSHMCSFKDGCTSILTSFLCRESRCLCKCTSHPDGIHLSKGYREPNGKLLAIFLLPSIIIIIIIFMFQISGCQTAP